MKGMLGAALCLNLKVGTGRVHGANAFVFWKVSGLCAVNILTVEGDVFHSLGL